ncbi:MAG: choice-of-anchor L domain-containing protein [Bacteroidetes bacterium]|nr:choice-of-anchor L domain-containing protein [Bacteroidota bacterium]
MKSFFNLPCIIFSIAGILFLHSAKGQLTINSAVTANQLVQALVGNGLQVSNVTLNCSAGGYGSFSNGVTTNLGLNNGIVLSSGAVDSIPGTNSSSSVDVSYCFNATSCNDPDLTALDPNTNHEDCCVLEFDLIPHCDSLSIRFVFGSEEYPNFVNSFNDLFGFFITGPNPSGPAYAGTNIATLPNGQYVSINNVNNGNSNTGPCVNCAYYIDNTGGATISLNAFTTVLTTTVGMVPCQTYHFKIAIADAIDCIYDSSVFVDFLQCTTAYTFTSNSVPDQCNSCTGTASVNVTGGLPPYTYTWLPSGGNAATATNLCAGTYSVLITDASSCGVPDTAIINVGNIGSLSSVNTAQNVTCNGACNGSIVLNTSGGTTPYVYTWTPNVSTVDSATGLCPGTYTVDVADQSGCTNSYTFTVTQPTALALSVTGTNAICIGKSTTLVATPSGGTAPYTVNWMPGNLNGTSQTFSPTVTTTYTATVTDANGCTQTQPFTVTVNPSPVAAFAPGQGGCVPSIVNFTDASTGGISYNWDFGDPTSMTNTSTLQNPSHIYTQAGTYNVTLVVVNGNGCSDTLIMNAAVTTYAYPTALFSVNTDSVGELTPDIIFTDAELGGDTCVFYFGDGDSLSNCNFGTNDHTYPGAGYYTAMEIVTNAAGCVDTFMIDVVVGEETSLYVPNAFTPNGAPPNEIFLAYGVNVQKFHMMVFDRWGNLLFESSDINKGWDGTYKGHLCPEDTYVWKIDYVDTHGKMKKLYGHVTMVR